MCVENREGYWLEEQEAQIVYLLWQLLTHSNARVVGQNLLYDFQYTWRWWRFAPRLWHDTMVRQHVAFCEQPKALDFQASIYCERYRYWKDDGKEWTKGMGEEVLWSYNCEDCVRTWEVDEVHDQTIPALRMEEIDLFQHKLFWSAFETMVRGKKRDEAKREEYAARLLEELEKRERDLAFVLEHPLNPRSPVQMHKLFYEDLRQPVHRNAKTKMPSLDDDALDAIKRRQPLLRPLIRRISEHRSIGVFIGTFINAKLDRDGRFRSSLNICGTGTYRLSSSKNAFGSGGNEQNIPGRAHPEDDSYLELPNIRELFIPDPNHTWFDLDLDRADLQIVVWEAEDEALKKALRAGVDMHLYNVRDVYGIDIPDDEIVESHPKCKEHKERYYAKRHACKAGVHATNYYCQPRKLALVLNCTVHEAEHFQRRWFGAHPGVLSWHRRVENDLLTKRQVRNAFGYVWRVFSRPDSVLPEALAWIPQSTVARVINEIWTRLDDTRTAEVLAQVHDSLAGQFPTADKPARIARIKELSKVVIPYPDPLVIGTGIKTSEISWGAC
jgi:DNA polymerase I-like protein with 3'-5' exonuclease and polymerase domains